MPTTLYRIKAWADSFENNRSRELKTRPWAPWPTDRGGRAYRRLARTREGVMAYGVFAALHGIAALCNPPGDLVRDNGEPLTVDDLTDSTGIEPDVLQDGIDMLVAKPIEWIQAVTDGVAVPSQDRRGVQDIKQSTEQNKDQKQKHAPEGAPVSVGTIAEASPTPKPKRAVRTKVQNSPWPDGWTFGDAEWATAERAGCPSRASGALAFEDFARWVEQKQTVSPKWNARWATWCAGCRDRHGWPRPIASGSGTKPGAQTTPTLTPAEQMRKVGNGYHRAQRHVPEYEACTESRCIQNRSREEALRGKAVGAGARS